MRLEDLQQAYHRKLVNYGRDIRQARKNKEPTKELIELRKTVDKAYSRSLNLSHLTSETLTQEIKTLHDLFRTL